MESGDTDSVSASVETKNSEVQKRVEEKLQKIASTNIISTQIVTTEAEPSNVGEKSGRGEVSAATVARMMGLATANEVSILEGKIDLLSTRLANLVTKMERLGGVMNQLPTGSDLDRIDINIGSLKTMIRDVLEKVVSASENEVSAKGEGAPGVLKNAKIMTNTSEED